MCLALARSDAQDVPRGGLSHAAVDAGEGLHRRPAQAEGGDGQAAARLLRPGDRQGNVM